MYNNKIFLSVLTLLILGAFSTAMTLKKEKVELQLHTNSVGDIHELVTYRSPTCGCCLSWVSYMKTRGYKIESIDVTNEELDVIKEQQGVPESLYACHTTVVNDGQYFIEGLVPEETITSFFEEQPETKGIGLPGMPSGSPGMPGAKTEPFNIMLIKDFNKIELYERI